MFLNPFLKLSACTKSCVSKWVAFICFSWINRQIFCCLSDTVSSQKHKLPHFYSYQWIKKNILAIARGTGERMP